MNNQPSVLDEMFNGEPCDYDTLHEMKRLEVLASIKPPQELPCIAKPQSLFDFLRAHPLSVLL